MKISIAQLNPTIGDLPQNAQHILEAARQAQSQGARLMLTPELSLCGYPPRDLLLQPAFVQAIADALEKLARELPQNLAVLVGTVVQNAQSPQGGKPLFNSSALLENGRVQQYFHKRLLPTYDVFDEDRYFEPGLESTFFQMDGLKVGVTICEDLWNDEEFWGKRSYTANPIGDLTEQGVDFVVNLSASPYSAGKQKIREAMLSHSAKRYRQPILYANQVGGNDDLLFDGNSFGVNRAGDIIFRANTFQTDFLTVEFDESRRDFVLFPDAISPAPENEDIEIWMALVTGVRDYVQKCGFQKIVLGLSGGIDSSLVAAIATAAIGPENVLGVLMPSPYSSDHSVKDALDLAQSLGIRTEILPIGDLMKTYDATFSKLFTGTEFGIAEENIQSRIRGNLLMAISNKFGHLLISTGNKSEMAVGYCTLYGDMNGGLAAIADVPKTRVYSICQTLNHLSSINQSEQSFAPTVASHPSTLFLSLSKDPPIHPSTHPPIHPSTHPPILVNQGPPTPPVPPHPPIPLPTPFRLPPNAQIPPNVLSKPPSAELKPGQVDQDSLPPYEVLDDILERFIEEHQSPDAIASAGHDPQIVNKVVRLVTRAEFKRKQAPPGLKITDRAFGTGWRVPIANHWMPKGSRPSRSLR
jgi:NAD+ synthase (glutamine-hydrolysing)